MDSQETRPLTVAEARERVLLAAERASPREWIRENPLEALAGAFLAGLSAGSRKDVTGRETMQSLETVLRFLGDFC